jgi:hypothetical protein
MISAAFKTILCLLFFVCTNASASILYINDGRFVNLTTGGGHLLTPTTPFGSFNVNISGSEAGAFQNSSMDNTSMTGTGTTYAGADASLYGATGRSVYDVTFAVDQLTNFSLNGSTTNFLSTVSGSLLANGGVIFATPSSDGVFSFNGLLTPGTQYQLKMDSFTSYSDYQNVGWQFDLKTSPVPVPAAAWLLGSGLLGLIGVARKRKAA